MENESELDTLEVQDGNDSNVSGEDGENQSSQTDLTAKVKDLTEKNKQLFERAKKAEDDKKNLKEELKKSSPQVKPDVSTVPTDPLKLVKLTKAFSDFDADEVEFITSHAKSSNVEDLIASANDEWVKRAIKARREEIEINKKTPAPTSPGSVEAVKSPQDAFKLAYDKSVSDEEIDKKTRELFEAAKKSGRGAGA